MKKFIIILLVISIFAAVMAGVSFFLLDREAYSYEEGGFNDFKLEGQLENFSSIEAGTINAGLIIEKGSRNEIYINKTKRKNVLDYKVENGVLNIKADGNNRNITIKVTSTNPEELSINIDSINGALIIEDSVGKFDVNNINGVLKVKGADSFSMNIGTINGALNMEFQNPNVDLYIDNLNSPYHIFEESGIKVGDKGFRKIIEDGRDRIEIGTVNGGINIK